MTTTQFEKKHGHAAAGCCIMGLCGKEALEDARTLPKTKVHHAECETKAAKDVRRYWANPGGDDGLRNGSFVRTRRSDGQLVQWMNGDCMGIIAKLPVGFTEVSIKHAESLIPDCCK